MLEQYGAAGIFAGVAQVLYLGTAFGVGGHLLLRGLRRRGQAELMLGLHLLLTMGLGYLILSVGLVAMQQGLAEGVWTATLLASGYFATIAGLVATLHFNRIVFRRESAGALGFASAAGMVMAAGWVGYGAYEGFSAGMDGGWFLFMSLGIIVANLWVATEPLRYYQIMLRRLRVGLAEPMVVDRFLLWGCGSLSRTAMAAIGLFANSLVRMDSESVGLASALTLIGASALGLFTSIAYALTFFPTRRYASWVERRYAARTS